MASSRGSGGSDSLGKEFGAEHRGELGVVLQGLGLNHKKFYNRKMLSTVCMSCPTAVLQTFKWQNQMCLKESVCLLSQLHLHVVQRRRYQGCIGTILQHGKQATFCSALQEFFILHSLAWHWRVIPKYIKQHDFLLAACCLFSHLLPKGGCLGSEVSSFGRAGFIINMYGASVFLLEKVK